MSPSAFPSPAAGGVLSGESLDAPVSVVTTLFRTGNFGASGLRTVVEGLVASGGAKSCWCQTVRNRLCDSGIPLHRPPSP